MDLSSLLGLEFHQVRKLLRQLSEKVAGFGVFCNSVREDDTWSRAEHTGYLEETGVLLELDSNNRVVFAEVDKRWPGTVSGLNVFQRSYCSLLQEALLRDPDLVVEDGEGFRALGMGFACSEGSKPTKPPSMAASFVQGYYG
jgi:hypothetical protein